MKLHVWKAMLLSLSLGACAGHTLTPPGERAATYGELQDGYRISIGDRIKITVYNEPGLSGEFTVGDTGHVSLPLAGYVLAQGQSAEQLAQEIEARLANGFLRAPNVSIEMAAYRPFYILGEVKAPGQYAFSSGLTVVNAIATAQGFTHRGQKAVVFIRKAEESEEKAYEMVPGLKVFPGDTIRVGERYF